MRSCKRCVELLSPMRLMLCALLVLLAASPLAFAQISAGGTPPSFSLSLSATVPSMQMTPVDVQSLLTEDEQAPKDEAYRFAIAIDVSLNLHNSGEWTEIPGGRLWRLRISSPGAYSLCLSYDHWYIPEGGQLFIYDDDHWQVIGAFTSFNNWVDGTNITQHVAGDASTLEYFEPDAVYGQSVLSISHVAHAYKNVHGKPDAVSNYGQSGTCNNNVNCPIGYNWQANKRGVTMVELSNGTRYCSGSLITNVAQDQTPYYLTANHCLGSSNSWIFVFNYEAPTCTNQDGPTGQTVANSTLRASNSASDFGLLQLSSTVPLSYAPYFNGWNNVDAPADSVCVIHHPSGDIKKISFKYGPVTSSSWSGTPANSHWRVQPYSSGTTEGGSSGSPLFDQNHRIVGQLHGGTALCTVPSGYDDYGKFAFSWNYGGSSSTRVRDWLDPANTHTVMDGYSPVSLIVSSPNGGETWAIGSSQAITWTSTSLSQNVKIELMRAYPTGSWETIVASTANTGSYTWTVSGTATTTARIRISAVTAISLNDISNANFTITTSTTPSITVTAPNGGENWLVGEIHNITWTSLNLTENVKIELNRSYPSATWETIVASTPNSGSYAWTVSGAATLAARVRITGTVQTTVGDSSNANFTIGTRIVTVTAPNGGETWMVGDANTIMWTSANLSENVKIELNRSYPSASWETIIASTTNTGSYSWTVSGAASGAARVRITGVTHTTVGDTSNANFTIGVRSIAVTSPNGGENWVVGSGQNISWNSQNLSGSVAIDLNRNYPAGVWESITASTANTGTYPWTVTGPTTGAARVRVSSVSYPSVADASDANFSIVLGNLPPVIVHDPLHDQFPSRPWVPIYATATVTDDAPGFWVVMFVRQIGALDWTIQPMDPGSAPNEFVAAVESVLPVGTCEYFLQAQDAAGLTTTTPTYNFRISANCSWDIIYDDGTAERSNWSQNTAMKWAVRFDPPSVPFAVCNSRIGISALFPETAHSRIQVSVVNANGPGGMPGTPMVTHLAGSIGNVPGGIQPSPDNWTMVAFRDNTGEPPIVNGPFYVVVSNPDSAGYESFLSDTSSVNAGRSYVYNACDSTWHSETVNDSVAFRGNRMIRVFGFGVVPLSDVVISPSGNNVDLNWSGNGAPYYHIYSALAVEGPYTTLEGSTVSTTWTDTGAAALKKFYRVYTSTTP